MDTYFIAFENALCSEWSGGQTRELLLLPEGSSYGRRDFSVRISSASVNAEESEFTLLPGVRRFLSVLEGRVSLFAAADDAESSGIKKAEKTDLFPGKVFEFDGGRKVISRGTCIDLNLMLNRGADGGMIFFPCGGRCNFKNGRFSYFVFGSCKEDNGGYSADKEIPENKKFLVSFYSQTGGETVVQGKKSMLPSRTLAVFNPEPGEAPEILTKAAVYLIWAEY